MDIMKITIVDSQMDAFEAHIETTDGRITVIALAAIEDRALELRDFHIDGPGPASLGQGNLRLIARHIMEQEDVDALVIHGWERTTGANPGHVPRRIRLRR